ncbi:FMN-binding negative transcriptional regulator [Microbulbifer hydrolyticus]|uniref:Transcriptional regulator n=1 Tax=Microbulbifer hydrolyticus TaxID=48074 RepID=A0A6P1TH66_9GAMM|nr:FMN-binding negative transcriptional regulator [Microbulbifer hydrolyticus]MBB5212543.1 transcriptional regulator [Microbulbifer hydrolyticus]QHQ40162.1 FMN-binding negative transcriptional regulator [Microbulbifer hydrolyticus]
MYIPRNFRVDSDQEIFNFVEANAFGQLVSNVGGRIFSTHLPVLLSGDRKHIVAHVAKANPQHKEIDGQEVLITLEGPHGYVSPSWYENPGVPTWNYQAVHIYGYARVFDDRDRLMAVVESLTAKYEKQFPVPWVPAYNEAMLNAIVGIEVEITEVQGKFKLGQNRKSEDIEGVVSKLRELGLSDLAEATEQYALADAVQD